MSTSLAIGIDLGTTYSCVGVFRHGKVEVIANEQGNRTTPSVVAFNDVERMVGDAAKNQAALNAKNTIFNAKRLIGRSVNDPTVQQDIKHWPFAVVDDEGKIMVQATFKGELKAFLPEVISSMVLANLKATAEAYLGTEVTDAVVTVPAYFNDRQRQATLDAGKIAGLNILRIINEPSAAAIAYGLEKKVDNSILIFDLGGGTLDVSVLTVKNGTEFTVLATAGDTHLGGEDFDDRLVSFLAEEFQRKHGEDLRSSPKALSRLRTAAERAKRTLSSCTTANVEIDSLFGGVDFSMRISRARFEDLCDELFYKTIRHVAKALADAKLDKAGINDVVLSGGSARIPKIQALLKNFFGGKELTQSINGDEAVAYGASIQAAVLSGCVTDAIRDVVMHEVTPLSLGIWVKPGDQMSVVIPRNTKIPCQNTEVYVTSRDNQTAMRIKVSEGERPFFIDNYFLGSFILEGLTPAPKGVTELDVTFDIDVNGILTVTAKEKGTDNEQNIRITGEDRHKLTAAGMNLLLEDAKRFKEDDAHQQKIIKARSSLEEVALQMKLLASSLAPEEVVKRFNFFKLYSDASAWLKLNLRPEPEECEKKLDELTSQALIAYFSQ